MSWAARRFYKKVSVESDAKGGFAVALDSRNVKTPAGGPLLAPTRSLAQAIAEEWDAQGEKVDPLSMPLMRLLCTAIDRVSPNREPVIDQVVAFAATDLVCYRAEGPADLVKRQEDMWQALLDWAATTHGATLAVTRGVVPIAQPKDALTVFRKVVQTLDNYELTAVANGTSTAGSLVIGLALVGGRLDADGAFAAAELDASFQIERWGSDDEAVARRRLVLSDLKTVERFVRLSRVNQ